MVMIILQTVYYMDGGKSSEASAFNLHSINAQ